MPERPEDPIHASQGSAHLEADQRPDHFPDKEQTLKTSEGATSGAEQASPSLLTEQLIDVPDYQLQGELNRGGMGVIYRARQISLDRMVALKVLLLGSYATPDQQARFDIEAKAVARLEHPGIVRIYQVGTHREVPYYAMELIEGESLRDRLQGQPLAWKEAVSMTCELAQAIQYAHDHNIIHRDLKPANVLCHPDGSLKLTDFGLAKLLDQDKDLTKDGVIMGTATYMPPEQARGEIQSIGPATDVYALGAILYELLTGRPLFTGKTTLEILDRVRAEEPEPPTKHHPEIPASVEQVCLKCLEKKPKDRYPSAEALTQALEQCLGQNGVTVPPRRVRFRNRPSRRAVVLSLLGILLAALAGRFYFAGSDGFDENREIVIGGKQFLESSILVEMMAAMIKHDHPGARVRVKHFYKAGASIFNELTSRTIDLYPGYSGTILTQRLGMDYQQATLAKHHEVAWLNEQLANDPRTQEVKFLPRFGFNNPYVMVMLRDRAEELSLLEDGEVTLSELAACSRKDGPLKFLGSHDFIYNREHDGFFDLKKAYDLNLKPPGVKLHSQKYEGLVGREMDLTNGYGTDPELYRRDDRDRRLFVPLEDDRNFFPAYHVSPVVHRDLLEASPAVEETLNKLKGIVTAEDMAGLISQAKALNITGDRLQRQPEARLQLRKLTEAFLRKKKVIH